MGYNAPQRGDTVKALDYTSIADKVKSRRSQLGYSLAELAELSGVNKSTLQRYESGAIKNIPLSRLQSLSAALDMEPDELIGTKRCGTPSSPDFTPTENQSIDVEELMNARFSVHPNPQKEIATPAEARLLDLHRQLNEEGQVRLHDYADDLVSSGKYIKTDPSHLVEDQEENVK